MDLKYNSNVQHEPIDSFHMEQGQLTFYFNNVNICLKDVEHKFRYIMVETRALVARMFFETTDIRTQYIKTKALNKMVDKQDNANRTERSRRKSGSISNELNIKYVKVALRVLKTVLYCARKIEEFCFVEIVNM